MPRNKVRIVTDACCKIPNAHLPSGPVLRKGHSACGVLIVSESDQIIHQYAKYLGEMTISQAEYEGLIFGLDKAAEVCRKEVEVWMDSEFVVRQMNGDYGIKSPNMKTLFDNVKTLEKRFSSVRYFHHPRTTPLARQADELANQELNKYRPLKIAGHNNPEKFLDTSPK